VHNLDVTARILLNGESTFLIFCDFKKLSEFECSKNITCHNLYVKSLTTTFRAQRTKRFLRTTILSNGYYFQLLVLLTMISTSPMHQSHHSLTVWMWPSWVLPAILLIAAISDRHVLHPLMQQTHCLVGHGDAPVLSEVRNPSSVTGRRCALSSETPPPATATYRASGLVPWHSRDHQPRR
jgi:hypothetical protein